MSTIAIRGARQHNLASIDLDLPRDRLIVVCGVSGSGKSSLAFDTLHAEGQRRYLEALAGTVRGARRLPPADVDGVYGLPPTIALDQRWSDPDDRATVGSQADATPILRVLWARAGVQHCPRCDAEIRPLTHDAMVGRLLALPAGTALTVEAPVTLSADYDAAIVLAEVQRQGFSRIRVGGAIQRVEETAPRDLRGPISVVVDRIRMGADEKRDRLHDAVRLAARAGQGVVIVAWDDQVLRMVDRPYCAACGLDLPALEPRMLSGRGPGACPVCSGVGCGECDGSGLGPAARAVRWRGMGLGGFMGLDLREAAAFLADAPADPVADLPRAEAGRRIGALLELGLGALTLGRRAATLSTGELQRIRLARAVAGRLSGVLYVLDEPAAGLGGAELAAVVTLLRSLVTQGSTVLAVEHNADVIRAADLVIELGPGAGVDGGRVVYVGDPAGLLAADTRTGRWLSGRSTLSLSERVVSGTVAVGGLTLPRVGVAAILGPSASGKSRLLDQIQAMDLGFGRVVRVDRIGARAGRSMPATYLGIWDLMRDLLAATREAQIRGFPPSFFSLNVKGGRCEACQGSGERRIELQILPDLYVPCEVCGGRRFAADVREVRWKGRSPDELLELRGDEAFALLSGHPKLENILRAMHDVGLGYVPLGISTAALSGGEAQRLALARELVAAGRPEGTLYLLDAPTVGLHPADVAALLGALRRLADQGGTVWCATHDAAFAAACDVVIPL